MKNLSRLMQNVVATFCLSQKLSASENFGLALLNRYFCLSIWMKKAACLHLNGPRFDTQAFLHITPYCSLSCDSLFLHWLKLLHHTREVRIIFHIMSWHGIQTYFRYGKLSTMQLPIHANRPFSAHPCPSIMDQIRWCKQCWFNLKRIRSITFLFPNVQWE